MFLAPARCFWRRVARPDRRRKRTNCVFVRSFDREALPHRVAVVAATCAEAAVALRAVAADDVALAKSSATCALLFPGQGSQRAAMGRGL